MSTIEHTTEQTTATDEQREELLHLADERPMNPGALRRVHELVENAETTAEEAAEMIEHLSTLEAETQHASGKQKLLLANLAQQLDGQGEGLSDEGREAIAKIVSDDSLDRFDASATADYLIALRSGGTRAIQARTRGRNLLENVRVISSGDADDATVMAKAIVARLQARGQKAEQEAPSTSNEAPAA